MLIIVCGIDQGVRGQGKNLVVNRAIERNRVTILKVRSAAAIDQQRIPGKYPLLSALIQKIAMVRIRVARSEQGPEIQASKI